ncbi:GNAT family N-acetyltransferase [Chryseobacterium profundimaris]|uniref:Ribosomal protein S18 acetylase RimI n=1 Tax=Chryseobacterium profundimaris TaxID=1387275 RepID=A0ABY1PAP2_9FLAO|nr:GNAT family N-acetyltransferase [Chryseobacterium profundimaris]SMP29314.1 Ribosomal protein S18 acetylase RimI [Chryseobacterium profundimaris]
MKFIQAKEKDIPLIQNLAKRSWEAAYGEILSPEQIEYMLRTLYSQNEISLQIRNINYHYYLIFDEINNSFEGFIGYENSYQKYTTKLHRIYLVPESKGKGVGRAAIDFLKDKVSAGNDRRIILNVNKNNQAKKFYESQGFTVFNEVVVDIGSGFVMDDYEMEFLFHQNLT